MNIIQNSIFKGNYIAISSTENYPIKINNNKFIGNNIGIQIIGNIKDNNQSSSLTSIEILLSIIIIAIIYFILNTIFTKKNRRQVKLKINKSKQ